MSLIIAIVILGLCISSKSTAESLPNHPEANPGGVSIDPDVVARIEAKQQKEVAKDIDPWLLEELRAAKLIRDFGSSESFIFELGKSSEFLFRWNSPPSGKLDSIMIGVFEKEQSSELTYVQKPQVEEFIQILWGSSLNSLQELGKVYVSKIFSIGFEGKEIFLKVKKNYDKSLIVEIDIKREEKIDVHSHLKDGVFESASTRLHSIHNQRVETDRVRSHIFKWSWGFLEKEERYDQEMLKLTGVELLVILATAIIQMYCLKALMENRRII